MQNYIERLELPDGQWATLLTRLPTDRALAVRLAYAREAAQRGEKGIPGGDPAFMDAVTRAHLHEAHLRDYLTGEWVDAAGYGKADPTVTDTIQGKAFVLYVEWSEEAYPGPKGTTPTPDSQTLSGGEEASTTSEPEPSAE